VIIVFLVEQLKDVGTDDECAIGLEMPLQVSHRPIVTQDANTGDAYGIAQTRPGLRRAADDGILHIEGGLSLIHHLGKPGVPRDRRATPRHVPGGSSKIWRPHG
jgi:hypothetical protein